MKDGVPGRLGASGVGVAIEREVRGEPRGIKEIVEARKILQKIRSEESGRGKDHEFGLKFSVAGEDACGAARLRDAVHHLAGADVSADAFEEAAGDPAVAFRPGEWAFFIELAGRKIMNAGPSGSAARERAVIVAAGVVHVPVQEAGIEALLAEPIGKRDAVQILKLRGEPELERHGERTGLAKFAEEIFEALKLIAVFGCKADSWLDAVLPTAVEKQPLLR